MGNDGNSIGEKTDQNENIWKDVDDDRKEVEDEFRSPVEGWKLAVAIIMSFPAAIIVATLVRLLFLLFLPFVNAADSTIFSEVVRAMIPNAVASYAVFYGIHHIFGVNYVYRTFYGYTVIIVIFTIALMGSVLPESGTAKFIGLLLMASHLTAAYFYAKDYFPYKVPFSNRY